MPGGPSEVVSPLAQVSARSATISGRPNPNTLDNYNIQEGPARLQVSSLPPPAAVMLGVLLEGRWVGWGGGYLCMGHREEGGGVEC